MRALRYGPFWLLVGAVLVLTVMIASLMPVPRDMSLPNDKLLHMLVYLVLGLWFGAVYQRERFAQLLVGLTLLGLLIECLQFGTGYRSFDLVDVLADALGVAGGLALAATPLGGILLLLERCLLRRD